jgi:hypothetical protein
MAALTGNGLAQLLGHAIRWLANLRRARDARKRESILALRRVITAARETAVYLRQLHQQQRDHDVERRLTVLWTELGFALQDLGLSKLAKRCHVTGKHWAVPDHYREDYLRQADIGLERMEQLAAELLAEIERRR